MPNYDSSRICERHNNDCISCPLYSKCWGQLDIDICKEESDQVKEDSINKSLISNKNHE